MDKEVKFAGDLDRLSDLGDPILCHILSFLPTKLAVRTSILSSRWRYLYVSSISSLVFGNCLWQVPLEYFSSFNNFVDRFFFYPEPQVHLERFWVDDISYDVDYSRLYGWLCAALWRRTVKHINIYSEAENLLILPTTLLFTSQSLVNLNLFVREGELNVPTKICLPNLKILHLSKFQFPDGYSILNLISNCHALKDLDFSNCVFHNISELSIHSLSLERLCLDYEDLVAGRTRDFDYTVMINAPRLVYFVYIDIVGKGYTLSNMNCLEKADIRITQLGDEDCEPSATRLLQGINNVKSLKLIIHDSESIFLKRVNPVLVFHNLVDLEFGNHCGDWNGRWLVEFLHCIPNLRRLDLKTNAPREGVGLVPNEAPPCLLFHLKEIGISPFVGDTTMFEVIGYFLKHGLVLESLTIHVDMEEENRVFEKLSSLPKESMKCQVVLNATRMEEITKKIAALQQNVLTAARKDKFKEKIRCSNEKHEVNSFIDYPAMDS